MSPTLNKDDRVIVNKIKVTFDLLDHGDIIMYRQDGRVHFNTESLVSLENQLKLEIIIYTEMIDV